MKIIFEGIRSFLYGMIKIFAMINIYDTLFWSIKKGYMGPEREGIKLCISTIHSVLSYT